jgi:tetratricopeptide (TPR) repeat protein
MRSLIVLLVVIPMSILQSRNIDSLAKTIPITSKSDFDLLFNQAKSIASRDQELALVYLNKVLERHENDSAKITAVMIFKAKLLFKLGRNAEANDILNKVTSKKETDFNRVNLGIAYNLLCAIHTSHGDFRKALKNGYKARLIFEENKIEEQYGVLYKNLGFLYFKIQNFEKAIFFYRKAVEWDHKAEEQSKSLAFFNISLCYSSLDSIAKAFSSVAEGYKICNKNCTSLELLNAEYALGMANFKNRDFQKAKAHFARSLAMSKTEAGQILLTDNLRMLGSIYHENHDYDSALVFLKEAESILNATKCDKCLLNTYENLIAVYESKQQVREQSDYQEKYINLKDEMFNAELMRDLAIVEGKHLEKEHLEEIAFQEEQLAAQEEMMKYQLAKAGLIGVVCLLLVILVIMQIKSVRIKKTIHIKLEQKVQERIRILEEKKRAVLEDQERKKKALEEFTTESKRKLHNISKLLQTIEGDSEIVNGIKQPVARLYDYLNRIELKNEIQKVSDEVKVDE